MRSTILIQLNRAVRVYRRLGQRAALLDPKTLGELLSGTNCLCQALHSLVKDSVTDSRFEWLDNTQKEELVESYKNLAAKAYAAVKDSDKSTLHIRPSHGHGDSDVLMMIEESSTAWHLSAALSATETQSEQASTIAMFAHAAIRAVAATLPLGTCYRDTSEDHYLGLLEAGIDTIDDLLWGI